jgi:Flp pilus assembly protein TadG
MSGEKTQKGKHRNGMKNAMEKTIDRNGEDKILAAPARDFFSRSREGMALPMALLVMMLFAILCVSMFTLSHMSLNYDLYFERRAAMEHATISMASALSRRLQELISNDTDEARDIAEGNGFLLLNSTSFDSAYTGPAMKFTFDVTTSSDRLLLFVKGEYEGAWVKNDNIAWRVLVDVAKTPGANNEIQDIAFGLADPPVSLWSR